MVPRRVLKLRKAAASRYAEEVQRPAEDQALTLHSILEVAGKLLAPSSKAKSP